MNTESAKGQRRETVEELIASKQNGDWWIDEEDAKIWIRIPGDGITPWPYRDPLPNGSCWRWNGDKDSPTLEPSLHLVGYWHGYLRNGELISA